MGRNALLAVFALAVAVLVALAFVGCHSDSSSDTTAADIVSPSQAGSQGDFNGNGAPDVTDAVRILRIIVALDPPNALADCNCDGETTVSDAILLLRCVVGLDDWPLVCGADVPLGPVRMVQPGDTWDYAVTGHTTADGGGVTPFTPTNGYFTLSEDEVDLGFDAADTVRALTMHWDVGYPDGARVEHWVMALAQLASGELRFYGISVGEGEPDYAVVDNANHYFPLAEVTTPGAVTEWDGQVAIDGLDWANTAAATYQREGIETIEVNGVAYECYRGAMTMELGFDVSFTAWINPAVGFVRVIFELPVLNAVETQQLDLQSTSFDV